MLSKPSPQVISALASLQGNPSFETVRGWLEESLQNLYADGARTKDEVLCRWQQGAVQAVAEILDKAKDAPEVIRRSR
jgi:hypothetical protein